jgi:hypothetical protein
MVMKDIETLIGDLQEDYDLLTYDREQESAETMKIANDIAMAIALLKEQEVKPVKVVKMSPDYELYYCPRCDRPFCDFYYVKPKFCDKCGQKVKWDD